MRGKSFENSYSSADRKPSIPRQEPKGVLMPVSSWEPFSNMEMYRGMDHHGGKWTVAVRSLDATSSVSYTLPMVNTIEEIMATPIDARNHAEIWFQLSPQHDVILSELSGDFAKTFVNHFLDGSDTDIYDALRDNGFKFWWENEYPHGTIKSYQLNIGKGCVDVCLHSSGTFSVDYIPKSGRTSYYLITTRMAENVIWPDGVVPIDRLGSLLPYLVAIAKNTKFKRIRT